MHAKLSLFLLEWADFSEFLAFSIIFYPCNGIGTRIFRKILGWGLRMMAVSIRQSFWFT